MEENGNIMEENENYMEEWEDIDMEENDDNMEEEDDNTEGGLTLYQLSTSAIVRNFSAHREGILRCPDKILFDVFYQVFTKNIITIKNCITSDD